VLRVLDVALTRIDHLPALPCLEALDMFACKLRRPPPTLSTLTTLRDLNMSHNPHLTASDLEILRPLTRLTRLTRLVES
jgi:Leucine-rich repeat (LRR) protein